MSLFPLATTNTLRRNDSGVYLSESRAIDYSEGTEAEEYLRQILTECPDLSSCSAELENAIKDWSSEYHLTATRANILRCLNLKGIENVLELGCGCGSITRYLGECGMRVDAVEGGQVRAELARLRCRDLDSVEIIQANFHELQYPQESYDAVIMIGVIEYAAMFSQSCQDDRAAIAELFSLIKPTLKPGGILILALENRMGLKYLYGAGEDHLSQPYLGIYDYPGKEGVRSYSRNEWLEIFRQNQWQACKFLYPFPDYKIPRVVLGDEFVKSNPFAHSLLYRIDSRDYLSSWSPDAHEFLSWKGVHKASLLPDLANSFLIVVSADEKSVEQCANKDFVHFSGAGRQPTYRTITSKVHDDKNVSKVSLSNDRSVATGMEQHLETSLYYRGELLVTYWLESLLGKNPLDELSVHLQEYYSYLIDQFASGTKSNIYIELIPSNIIVEEPSGTWQSFDLEWKVEKDVSAEFVFFRAVLWFVFHNKTLILQACREVSIRSVGDFISFCFSKIGQNLDQFRLHYIELEEYLHRDVTTGMGQGLDVSYLLAQPLLSSNDDEGLKIHEAQSPLKQAPANSEIMLAFAKKSIKMISSYLLNSQCRKIRRSRLFDGDFYVSSDKALQKPDIDPLYHFVTKGCPEGRDPSPFFSLEYYRRNIGNKIGKDINPLVHYIDVGWKNGTVTHPLLEEYILNPGSYLKKPELVKRTESKEGLGVHSYFDAEYYCTKYPDIDCNGSSLLPVEHYLRHGGRERRQPGPYFDPQWYVDRTPFYGQERGDLLDHYLKTGAKVGKSPIPVFDQEFYWQHNANDSHEKDDIFGHYLQYAIAKDIKPCSWFDPEYYRQGCPDLSPYHFPLDHYLYKGVHDKIYVNEQVANLSLKPLISIVVPVYNVKKEYLNCCIRSVLYQSYPHWELCIVDDGSTETHIRPLLLHWADVDERIKVKFLHNNRGISRASNAAADLAKGQFLAFLDNDDELHPEALFYMVEKINTTGADLLYSDEDLIGDDGRQFSIFHKPDFNRELLFSHNYITHFVLTHRTLFTAVGGFSPFLSGAQDYDLFLKLSEEAKKIEHLPKVLYHWRASESSTSVNHEEKQYADNAGKQALRNMLGRRNVQGEICETEWKFFYRVKRQPEERPKISVLILDRADATFDNWLRELVSSCHYPNAQFMVCCEKSRLEPLKKHFCADVETENLQFLQVNSLQEPARCYNEAAKNSDGQQIVFLSPSLQKLNIDWLEALLEYSLDSTCGLVGGKIVYGEEEYTLPDINQESPLYYARFIQQCSLHLNGLQCAQYASMLSCQFAMITKEVFLQVGGFDEINCSNLFFDSDLSLRLKEKGFNNVYTPFASGKWAIGQEVIPKTEKTDNLLKEKRLFQQAWHDFLVNGDPFYNVQVVLQNGISRESFINWYAGTNG